MGFFDLISLLLKLIGLWEGLLDFIDKKHSADMEERRQRREKAIEDQKNAQSEKEFDDAQDSIVDNSN